GTRALFEAIGMLNGVTAERHHGRASDLERATDATLVFAGTSLPSLLERKGLLAEQVDRAVRQGARLVLLLSDDDARRCRKLHCFGTASLECHRSFEEIESGSRQRPLNAGPTCADAPPGLWGFSISGAALDRSEVATRSGGAAGSSLPSALPWHTPAFFA